MSAKPLIQRPDRAVFVQDGFQRHIVRLWQQIIHKAHGKAQAHGVGVRFQSGQCAVVKTTAITQSIAPGP